LTSISIDAEAGQQYFSLIKVLDKTAPPPVLRVSPPSFSVSWFANCDSTENFPATSPRGVFSINGKEVASTGSVSTAMTCFIPPQPPVVEMVLLPKALIDAVLDEFLRTTRVIEVVNDPYLVKSITVVYSRTFTVAASSSTSSISIVFNLRPDVIVNNSRLVSVSTRGLSTLLPVNAGAGAIPVIPVTWVASIETTGKGKSLTIRSDAIEYRTESGQLIQVQRRPLTKIFTPGFADNGGQTDSNFAALLKGVRQSLINDAFAALSSLVFSETLSIPKSVLVRARQLRATRVIASRRFTDGTVTFSAEFLLPMGSSNLFQITRVDLYFPGGIRTKVIEKDAALRVIADINYIGTGQLRGLWEWAPVQPGGVPLFRPLPPSLKRVAETEKEADYYKPRDTLTLVREYLTSFQKVSLRSPLLPTNNPGSYVLRLRIDSPEVNFTLPIVQYFIDVKPELLDQVKSIIPLLIINPPPGQSAMASTNFRWSSVPETSVYRFEIYLDEAMSSNMVAATLIKNENTNTMLSPLMYDHLVGGKTYWFRVVSIDKEGKLVANSQLSPLIVR